jgi:gluconate 2-dehydrogenase gamma chain
MRVLTLPPRLTRRQFLSGATKLGAAGAMARTLPLVGLAACDGKTGSAGSAAATRRAFDAEQRRALDAALERMIPADGPGDWSAADAGAADYIETLLTAFDRDGNPAIYAGGPTRDRFGEFQRLPRVKEIAWRRELERLRAVYVEGLAELDRRAGGDFAGAPATQRDAVLASLDLEGSPFFAALYDHTMEGVYGHPAYGGNRDFVAWRALCYQGDVHGVHFPNGRDPAAVDRAWDEFGGYSPEEIVAPGKCPGQGPAR